MARRTTVGCLLPVLMALLFFFLGLVAPSQQLESVATGVRMGRALATSDDDICPAENASCVADPACDRCVQEYIAKYDECLLEVGGLLFCGNTQFFFCCTLSDEDEDCENYMLFSNLVECTHEVINPACASVDLSYCSDSGDVTAGDLVEGTLPPSISTPVPSSSESTLAPSISTPVPSSSESTLAPSISTPVPSQSESTLPPSINTPTSSPSESTLPPSISTPVPLPSEAAGGGSEDVSVTGLIILLVMVLVFLVCACWCCCWCCPCCERKGDDSSPQRPASPQESSPSTTEGDRCPNQVMEIQELAGRAYRSGSYQRAFGLYSEAIGLVDQRDTATKANLLAHRAATLTNLGRNEDAVRDCDQALYLKPDYPKVLLRKGRLHSRLGQWDLAIQALETCRNSTTALPETVREAKSELDQCRTSKREAQDEEDRRKREAEEKKKEMEAIKRLRLELRPKGHYDTLGVAQTADASEIRKAYFKLAKVHHPDKNDGDVVSFERFKGIQRAYDVLRKPAERRAYDATL